MLISTKNSGKTTVILNLIKHLVPLKTSYITKINWFSPSYSTDNTILNAQNMLKKYDIQFHDSYEYVNFKKCMDEIQKHNETIDKFKNGDKEEEEPTPE